MDCHQFKEIAKLLRKNVLEAIYYGGSGHPGGSLSLADIMAVLYGEKLNIDPKNPKAENRDRVVLSKGHAAPILYASLAYKGFFEAKELKKLRHIDSFLQGHPEMKHTPGVDMTTGSLGQGISAACGMALGLKKKNSPARVYAIIGDGEMEEGQVWEALMFANQYKLSNLTIILDFNKLQIDGSTSEVMDVDNPADRFKDFHLNCIEIDAHNYEQIASAIDAAKNCAARATVIVAHTIKGKGVSFMENQVNWHGKAPTKEELNKALDELDHEGK